MAFLIVFMSSVVAMAATPMSGKVHPDEKDEYQNKKTSFPLSSP